MCREGALTMYSSSNCAFYLCTGVVVTVSYSCVLEIQSVHLFILCHCLEDVLLFPIVSVYIYVQEPG